MVLESTMICFDNSDYQRNGDYSPSRLFVQKEAANLVASTKLRKNVENNIGLMTIADTVQVLATLTNEMRMIYSKMHDINIKGEINLLTGIRIAQLALKHRHGKNHKMRIVVFIGSPLPDIASDLVMLAKRLKKEKVNVDVVNFGGYNGNNEMLTTFVDTLNGKDGVGSTFLNIPRGSDITHALIASPIIRGDTGANNETIGLTDTDFDLGFDPNIDPDLALALRISLEEQHQRERETIDLTQHTADASTTTNLTTTTTPMAMPSVNFATMSEDELIAYAIQMSMSETQNPKPTEGAGVGIEVAIGSNDDETLLQTVLENLPGVEPDSECVREAVGAIDNETKEMKEKKDKKDDKKDGKKESKKKKK